MILEGIVTTINADASVNISPMGPEIDRGFDRFVLKPFPTSTTFQNLQRTGQGVLHITDDVELLARAAIGKLQTPPPLGHARIIDGWIIQTVCRWYAFRVTRIDTHKQRARLECEVVKQAELRPFFGFNRAKHAVVEAAILATRVALLPAIEIQAEFKRLAPLVEKTGGPTEHAAFALLKEYVAASGGA